MSSLPLCAPIVLATTPECQQLKLSRIVLDTEVASRLFKGQLPGPLFAKIVGRPLAVTCVTVSEMPKWTVTRKWEPRVVLLWSNGLPSSRCCPATPRSAASGARSSPTPSSVAGHSLSMTDHGSMPRSRPAVGHPQRERLPGHR